MAFKRINSLDVYPTGEELTKKLIGIGFKLGGKAEYNYNIENCLIAACLEGVSGDYRVLSMLTDWIFIHHKYINTDRLYRALKNMKNDLVKCYFASISFSFKKENGYKKLITLYKKEKILLSDEFLIKKNGEDERFVGTKLVVPNKMLRSRKEDILTITELAIIHKDYFYRVLIGPGYRADMISNYLRSEGLSPTELAHRTYGSFASAWGVINEIAPILKVKH